MPSASSTLDSQHLLSRCSPADRNSFPPPPAIYNEIGLLEENGYRKSIFHHPHLLAAGMDVLESPFEAFLHALYSSDALQGFWVWLSLHTTILSVWLRQFFYCTTVESHPSDASPATFCCLRTTDVSLSKELPSVLPLPSVSTAAPDYISKASSIVRHADDGRHRRERFTVYFHEGGFGGEDTEEEELVMVAEEAHQVCKLVDSFDLIRLTPQGRREDFSWYRCQDLTVLNGSVVRFWDDAGSKTTSPMCRRLPFRRPLAA